MELFYPNECGSKMYDSSATKKGKRKVIVNILSSPSVSVTPLGSGFKPPVEVIQSGEKSSQTTKDGTWRNTQWCFSEKGKIRVTVQINGSSPVSVKLLESNSETLKETPQVSVPETVETTNTPTPQPSKGKITVTVQINGSSPVSVKLLESKSETPKEAPRETVPDTVKSRKTPAKSRGKRDNPGRTEPVGGSQNLSVFPSKTKRHRGKGTPKAPGGKIQNVTQFPIRENQLLPCGLHNFGNNCYVNASLQCLFAAEGFCRELTCLMNKYMCETEDPFLRCFVELNLAKYSQDQSDMSLNLLRGLIALATDFNPEFTTYRQNDAHEFLCYCLSQMEEAGQWMGEDGGIVPECPIRSNFVFTMFKLLTCSSCGYQRNSTLEIFNHLSVPLVQNSVSKCVSEITDSLTQLEINCSKCGAKFASCLNVFQSMPRFLILQLNRFKMTQSYTVIKLGNQVEIDPELQLRCHPNMDRFLMENKSAKARQTDSNELDGSTFMYKLTSILSHIGHSAHSGHYLTDSSSHSSHQWTTYDDERVSLTNLPYVLQKRSSSVYILLYERVDT